jgi:uncharacterized cupredoxin-like copper-binding protein
VPASIEIQAGSEVTLALRNEDDEAHDLQVIGLEARVVEGGATEGHGADAPGHGRADAREMGPVAVHTTARGAARIAFVAGAKGTYDVWCTLPGHKEAGMVGRLRIV